MGDVLPEDRLLPADVALPRHVVTFQKLRSWDSSFSKCRKILEDLYEAVKRGSNTVAFGFSASILARVPDLEGPDNADAAGACRGHELRRRRQVGGGWTLKLLFNSVRRTFLSLECVSS
jgi:hypothetical protein